MNEYRFDRMGHIYARFRPLYPKEFIDYLYSSAGFSSQNALADIGAGTGILTEQLLKRGSRVYAVEPNDNMRKAAEIRLQDFRRFSPINGSAETTGLPGGSIDHVIAAQSFHWFDRQKFKEECRRILVPGGTVVLVWNTRDIESDLMIENDEINRTYCTDYRGFSGGLAGRRAGPVMDEFFDGNYAEKIFRNDLTYTEDEFTGRCLSSSYAPKSTDAGYAAYISSLKRLFDRHSKDGLLFFPQLTHSYVGRVSRSGPPA